MLDRMRYATQSIHVRYADNAVTKGHCALRYRGTAPCISAHLRQQDLHAHKGSSQQCCEAAAPGLNASLSSPISSSRSPRRSTSCSTSTTRSAAEARREGARRRAAKCEAEEAKREAEKAKREAQEAKRNAEAEAEAEERCARQCAHVWTLCSPLWRARGFSRAACSSMRLAEGAWLLHCWGRAKFAAPVLLRVHVKPTGLRGRLLRSVDGRGALRRGSSLGGRQCRPGGRLTSRNTQSRASAGLLWRLSCNAMRGLAGVIEMAAEHGERRAGQLEAQRIREGEIKTLMFF